MTDDPAGTVGLGKIERIKGEISRESVAQVAAALLGKEGVKNTWLDLLNGDEAIDAAVDRCVREDVDCAEGEAIHK